MTPTRYLLIGLLLAAVISLFPRPVDAGCQQAAKFVATIKLANTWGPVPVCTSMSPGDIHCTEGTGSDAVVKGELNTPYAVYLIATDLYLDRGLNQIGLAVSYNDTAGVGVDVFGYLNCDTPLGMATENDWPHSGGGLVLSYGACATLTPESIDPYQGQLILGAMYVYAYSPDVFAITRRSDPTYPESFVRDCEGDSTVVRGLGAVEFGLPDYRGVDPCTYDFYAAEQGCCLNGGCVGLPALCCLSQGGVPLGFTCLGCDVPVKHSTWGLLKQKYGSEGAAP